MQVLADLFCMLWGTAQGSARAKSCVVHVEPDTGQVPPAISLAITSIVVLCFCSYSHPAAHAILACCLGGLWPELSEWSCSAPSSRNRRVTLIFPWYLLVLVGMGCDFSPYSPFSMASSHLPDVNNPHVSLLYPNSSPLFIPPHQVVPQLPKKKELSFDKAENKWKQRSGRWWEGSSAAHDATSPSCPHQGVCWRRRQILDALIWRGCQNCRAQRTTVWFLAQFQLVGTGHTATEIGSVAVDLLLTFRLMGNPGWICKRNFSFLPDLTCNCNCKGTE